MKLRSGNCQKYHYVPLSGRWGNRASRGLKAAMRAVSRKAVTIDAAKSLPVFLSVSTILLLP